MNSTTTLPFANSNVLALVKGITARSQVAFFCQAFSMQIQVRRIFQYEYCAGVTKGHFEKLSKSSTPYLCEWCSLKTTQSIIRQLQSEIANLKLELSKAKAALGVRPSTTPQATSSTYAATASRPPPKTSVNHPTIGSRDWLSHVSQARNSANTTASRGQCMERVLVQGVRRV